MILKKPGATTVIAADGLVWACVGKQQLPKQKPYPMPISVQKNEEEQSKCWNKHLLGKFDKMIQNESLTEEKS